MPKVTVDGVEIEVPQGATVLQACELAGKEIPRFCYHERLSIAGNCRMCLVEVAPGPPKPQASCALPAADGQTIKTDTPMVKKAREGVMEFLLINHPLDCPICDQGGECQLQDLAVGYGGSNSRYQEAKRVVVNKNLGPLIATDMTRCIHCTRCVRFGQEIAGVMELGMANRGENSEIMTFVGKTVNSELSGNMIDLCPVGALTSKPFRYSARTWELVRRRTVSPHDGLGSNLIAHVKNDRVMRVLPSENEAINECWISDRDRFSYDALNSEDRLLHPIIKRNGRWEEADWQIALEYVVKELARVRDNAGGAAIGAIGSPHATVEELYLLQKLARGLQSDNVDFRLRQSDFSNEGKSTAEPWLGMSIADFARLDRYFIIGSYLRKDQPLLSHRVRQATKRGAELSLLHAVDDDLLMRVTGKTIVPPSAMVAALSAIVAAAADGSSVARDDSLRDVAVDDAARAIAASLAGG
ncbi:MAG: NADH-quinone oxidoreductase subunit NuoG, partial [Sphingomicrobium sp.]